MSCVIFNGIECCSTDSFGVNIMSRSCPANVYAVTTNRAESLLVYSFSIFSFLRVLTHARTHAHSYTIPSFENCVVLGTLSHQFYAITWLCFLAGACSVGGIGT